MKLLRICLNIKLSTWTKLHSHFLFLKNLPSGSWHSQLKLDELCIFAQGCCNDNFGCITNKMLPLNSHWTIKKTAETLCQFPYTGISRTKSKFDSFPFFKAHWRDNSRANRGIKTKLFLTWIIISSKAVVRVVIILVILWKTSLTRIYCNFFLIGFWLQFCAKETCEIWKFWKLILLFFCRLVLVVKNWKLLHRIPLKAFPVKAFLLCKPCLVLCKKYYVVPKVLL